MRLCILFYFWYFCIFLLYFSVLINIFCCLLLKKEHFMLIHQVVYCALTPQTTYDLRRSWAPYPHSDNWTCKTKNSDPKSEPLFQIMTSPILEISNSFRGRWVDWQILTLKKGTDWTWELIFYFLWQINFLVPAEQATEKKMDPPYTSTNSCEWTPWSASVIELIMLV